jgi:dTDP-3-amino-3,4,6-trideoxy-alpha-D-glucose transaminase
VTNDSDVAERLRRLRNGGQTSRYLHVEAGINSRLDEIQAAILRARLPLLAGWTRRRRAIAAEYRRAVHGRIRPVSERDPGHVYHLFPVRCSGRDELQNALVVAGIETLIHYPVPLNEQPAFAAYSTRQCPVASRAARELLSLPLHPGLSDLDVERVVSAVRAVDTRDVVA